MNTTAELIAAVQLDRERQSRANRLAHLAASIRDCCLVSRFTRLARALRRAPAAC